MSPKTLKSTFSCAGKLTATSLTALILYACSASAEQQNVLFIMDSSNSMVGKVDGKPKYKVARTALARFVNKMPNTTKMGFASFGHRFNHKEKECDMDMELMHPVGALTPNSVNGAVELVRPNGQTPIAETLMQVPRWLEKNKGQSNTVVLVSDGVESCNGDPCAAAKALAESGITTKIHVVGFDLNTEQKAKIQCISDNGNGKYFDAKNTEALINAMDKVQADVTKPIVVAQTPTAEEPPKLTVVFEDEFDGDGLAEGWKVSNPNSDRYVAEAGELLMIAGTPASNPSEANMENVISQATALPKGDWEIEVKFKMEVQHGMEAFYFGTRNDHNGWIAAGIKPSLDYGAVNMASFLVKNESGKLTRFDNNFDSASDTSSRQSTARWKTTGFGEKYGKNDFVLILKKTGRSYTMSGTYSNDSEADYRSFKSEKLKMLRGKKNLFFAFGVSDHNKKFQGEGNVIIDYVKIRKVDK